MSAALREYQARLDARAEGLRSSEARERLISNLRLIVFAVGMALIFVVWLTGLTPAWLIAPGAAFVALVVAHDRAARQTTAARRAVAFYEAGLRRLDGRWPGHGEIRTHFAPDDHPYAADLDLFGRGSLFDRLCQARTAAGVGTLAHWLLAPADPATVLARQAAVAELADNIDLREALALAGHDLDAEIEASFLAAWGEAPPRFDPGKARWIAGVAWVVAAANVLAATAWGVGWVSPLVLAASLLVTWVAWRPHTKLAQQLLTGVERPARELAIVAAVLARLQGERFDAPRLVALQGKLSSSESSAAQSIAALVRIVAWLDAQRSGLFAPVAWALMWGVHFGLALERWRARHGRDIGPWFEALGELEALASLSAYAFERPDDVFPQLVEGEPSIEGEAVGHPLLPSSDCVTNPIALGPSRRALVVSGSNMSGKSTYLRTVGVAVVLAQAGAPVFATSFSLTPLRVAATLRVQDSLQGGASRFFAEITRLRAVMDVADAGPGLLFLLDEILAGTNSHDRRIGAQAVVAELLRRDGLGLVTTHDLALAEAAASMPATVDNVHFADTMQDGTLVFDYQLKAGTVTTSNALALMRAVGLEV